MFLTVFLYFLSISSVDIVRSDTCVPFVPLIYDAVIKNSFECNQTQGNATGSPREDSLEIDWERPSSTCGGTITHYNLQLARGCEITQDITINTTTAEASIPSNSFGFASYTFFGNHKVTNICTEHEPCYIQVRAKIGEKRFTKYSECIRLNGATFNQKGKVDYKGCMHRLNCTIYHQENTLLCSSNQ